MDLDSALKSVMEFDLADHCHVNSNEDGDRFVGIKADSDIVDISHLPKNIILIIQAGKQRIKVIIN